MKISKDVEEGYIDYVARLKKKGWKFQKTKVLQNHDGDANRIKTPDWGDGKFEGYICTKDKKQAIYLIMYDRTGSYDNFLGPNCDDFVADYKQVFKEWGEEFKQAEAEEEAKNAAYLQDT